MTHFCCSYTESATADVYKHPTQRPSPAVPAVIALTMFLFTRYLDTDWKLSRQSITSSNDSLKLSEQLLARVLLGSMDIETYYFIYLFRSVRGFDIFEYTGFELFGGPEYMRAACKADIKPQKLQYIAVEGASVAMKILHNPFIWMLRIFLRSVFRNCCMQRTYSSHHQAMRDIIPQ